MENFLEAMAEVLELDAVTAETRFRDTDVWDSLTALSLVAMVDKRFRVTISADDLANSTTVGDLWKIVETKQPR